MYNYVKKQRRVIMSVYAMSEDTKADLQSSYLSPLVTIQGIKERKFPEEKRSRADGEYQRDYTRIMYSSSFRRLQGKMQLLGIKHDQFFRNRLTHSLEVAQIARSLAYDLRYSPIDGYVVEAGALAHDIGNPPFGHAGEACLNKLCQSFGGYEGNAQTLRILTTIEKKGFGFQGLNLTYRTLLSVIKYFKKYDSEIEGKQKFIYDDDYAMLSEVIEKNHLKTRTLDVQIIDVSDEIAYAAHDLEDGLRQRLFNIDEILHDYVQEYGESESYHKLNEIVEASREKAGYGKKQLNSSEYSKLFRKELASSIIFSLIHDIDLIKVTEKQKIKTGTTQEKELGFSKYGELADGLKKITFKCINHNDEVYSYEQKGNEIIEYLFHLFLDSPNYLPPEYRAEEVINQYKLEDDKTILQKRLVADYVSGMMDSYAISTYTKFSGKAWVSL